MKKTLATGAVVIAALALTGCDTPEKNCTVTSYWTGKTWNGCDENGNWKGSRGLAERERKAEGR